MTLPGWTHSWDEEAWSCEERFESREAARDAATSCACWDPGEAECIVTAYAEPFVVGIDGEEIIETLRERISEECGLDDELDAAQEEIDDLGERLQDVFLEWAKNYRVRTDFWSVDKMETHVLETVPL
jgi:hypothetical protein